MSRLHSRVAVATIPLPLHEPRHSSFVHTKILKYSCHRYSRLEPNVLFPSEPYEARIFKLSNQLIFFMNSSSEIRHAAEKDGKYPHRLSAKKRERTILHVSLLQTSICRPILIQTSEVRTHSPFCNITGSRRFTDCTVDHTQ